MAIINNDEVQLVELPKRGGTGVILSIFKYDWLDIDVELSWSIHVNLNEGLP